MPRKIKRYKDLILSPHKVPPDWTATFFDNIQHYSTLFDNIQRYLTIFDIILHYSTIFDIIWQNPALFDNIRHFSTLINIFWKFDNIQHYPTLCDNIRHYSTIFDIIQQYSTLFDNIRHYSTQFDNFRPSNNFYCWIMSRSTLGGTYMVIYYLWPTLFFYKWGPEKWGVRLKRNINFISNKFLLVSQNSNQYGR